MHLASERLAEATFQGRLEHLALAPVNHPELLPTVLPLVIGAITIELYFGKHTQENLGWNSSVGNAIIWITTGLTLLLTTKLSSIERYAAYGLMGVGGIVGYMNFYHKWSSTVAFIISSSGMVHSLAYITVVVIKTDIPVDPTTIKAAVAFFLGVNVTFKLLQGLEKPASDDFNFR